MQLREVYTDDKPARYYIDGKRVSKDAYEYQITLARIQGKTHDTFHTTCKQLGNGRLQRRNYSCIR